MNTTIAQTAWLRRLESALANVQVRATPAVVRRIRVASERLRVWLLFSSHTLLREELKWLRDRAATVRDLDVLLARNPPARRSLEKKRAKSLRDLNQLIVSSRTARLLGLLSEITEVSSKQAEKVTRHEARKALTDKHRWIDAESLHRLRRRIRRVRYCLEWLDEPTTTLSNLQDELGRVCDAALALKTAKHSTITRELKHEKKAALKRARTLWTLVKPTLKALAQRK